jgi:hypothetical protein
MKMKENIKKYEWKTSGTVLRDQELRIIGIEAGEEMQAKDTENIFNSRNLENEMVI